MQKYRNIFLKNNFYFPLFHAIICLIFFIYDSMYLFFDAVSSNGKIALINQEKKIIAENDFHISWNESTQTIPIIHKFLSQNNVWYEEVENIIVVVGPWSFTGIRTITLVVNTLAYIYQNIKLTPIGFFDLFNQYPIVKSSSKRDLFVKYSKWDIIRVEQNIVFEQSCDQKQVYWDTNIDRFWKTFHINSDIDIQSIIENITFTDQKTVAPMYIKKPNIT